MQVFRFLNQKYPPPRLHRKSLGIALFFGLFIFGFLYYFEPFHINNQDYSFVNFAGFGLISFFSFLLFQNLLPEILPGFFSDRNWRVKHQILLYALILFCIATLNGMYINYIQSLSFSWSNYLFIITRTWVLGILPIFLIVLFDYNQKLRKNLEYAAAIAREVSPQAVQSKEVVYRIQTDLKEEEFSISQRHFLFARAEGNYVSIYTSDTPKALYRLTLNSLEKQLASKAFFRCHRSYLLNLKKVQDIGGNAQGLKVHLEDCMETVPVSRKYIPHFREQLRQSSL